MLGQMMHRPLMISERLKHAEQIHKGTERATQTVGGSAAPRRIFGVDLKIVDEDGIDQPQDGDATGALFVQGNTIVSGNYNTPEAADAAMDQNGWFGTGDVASIQPDGFFTITDRAKDLIKSGGEWISPIDVENIAMSHLANRLLLDDMACVDEMKTN